MHMLANAPVSDRMHLHTLMEVAGAQVDPSKWMDLLSVLLKNLPLIIAAGQTIAEQVQKLLDLFRQPTP